MDAQPDVQPAVEKGRRNVVVSSEVKESADLPSPKAHFLTTNGDIMKVPMSTIIREMIVSIPLTRVDSSRFVKTYDHTVPLIWKGKFFRKSTLNMFRSTSPLTEGDWPKKLSVLGKFQHSYSKKQNGVLFFEQVGESLNFLPRNSETTNRIALEYRRFEKEFVALMNAHREYILTGIIHIVMNLRMNSPLQREACIHLIWCFILNMIYNACVRQRLGCPKMRRSFTTFKSELKFFFLFPKTNDKLKGVIDSIDKFVKNIHYKFGTVKTYRSIAVPRCLLTL